MVWKRYSTQQAAARFDDANDFTVGVEEEFQILDPDSLALTSRFEQLQEIAHRRIGNFARGELIASEIEVCTDICHSMASAEADLKAKRQDLFNSATQLGVTLAATGTHPFADWRDQRIIDTPHYRVIDERLRYCAWRNLTFGMHTHVSVRGRERLIAVLNAMRGFLPHLLALSANSPFSEGRYTYLHSTRTQLFTKFFPRCGIPGPFKDWNHYAGLVETLMSTNSISEPTQIWWSIRPHPLLGTLEIRICDCQSDVEDTLALASLTVALAAALAADYDAGRLLPVLGTHEIEENLWRALRYGLDGKLVDFKTKREVAATDAAKRLIDYSAAAQVSLGLEKYIRRAAGILKHGNGAQQQIRDFERTGDIAAAFHNAVRRSQPAGSQATPHNNA